MTELTALEKDIVHNYRQYIVEDQTRNDKGRLISPLAETFEQRMNNALQSLYNGRKYAGSTALPSSVVLGED